MNFVYDKILKGNTSQEIPLLSAYNENLSL